MQIKPNYHHLLMLVCWALNSLSCKYGNSIIFLQLFFFSPPWEELQRKQSSCATSTYAGFQNGISIYHLEMKVKKALSVA